MLTRQLLNHTLYSVWQKVVTFFVSELPALSELYLYIYLCYNMYRRLLYIVFPAEVYLMSRFGNNK
jgi:hypothetical protein